MKTWFFAVLIAISIIVAGCTLHSISSDYTMKNQDESIVIGGLSFPETGIPLISKPLRGTEGSIKINTIIAQNYREYMVQPALVDNVWRFTIALPQGRYRITDLYWGDLKMSINGIFTVYENGKVYYIGSIKVNQVLTTPGQYIANTFLNGLGTFPVDCNIVDEYIQAVSYYKKTYPNLPQNVEKSMMVFKNDWEKKYNQFTPVKSTANGKESR